jgi:excisionase family DNA binding protein
MTDIAHIVPQPRRGLSLSEAARYVGVGTTKFDEMVKDGRMPKAFKIDGRVLWDIRQLDAALDNIILGASVNAWDSVA